MFLKVVPSAQNIDYACVVEGYRDTSHRTKQRYLFSLGKLEDFLNTSSFRKLAKRALARESKKAIELNKISEGKLLIMGIH